MPWAQLNPGLEIAGLRLLERIGEGGFGEVWRAEDRTCGDLIVAAKFPRTPEVLDALRREAGALAQLRSPFIVSLLRSDLASEPPCLIMEYVSAGTVRTLLEKNGPVQPATAVGILGQVLQGLSLAHSQGVVHGDLKPENVLLEVTDTGLRARVADFAAGRSGADFAKSIRRSAMSRGDVPSGVAGTLKYMAPEQQEGQACTSQSDVFTCGILLYELLMGHASPLRFPVPGVSPALSEVLEIATSLEPIRRFASAGEMSRALEEIPLLSQRRPSVGDDIAIATRAVPPPAPGERPGFGPWVSVIALVVVSLGGVGKVLTSCDRPSYTRTSPPTGSSPAEREVNDLLNPTIRVDVPTNDGTGREIQMELRIVTVGGSHSGFVTGETREIVQRSARQAASMVATSEIERADVQQQLEGDISRIVMTQLNGRGIHGIKMIRLSIGKKLK